MSIVAQWLNKKWEVSPQKVLNLSNLSTSYKLKTETSSASDGSTSTKVIGMELQQIKFETQLSDAVGVNVEEEINSWESLVGESGTFYLAGKSFGRNKMQLSSVDVSDTMLDDFGRIRKAKLSLLFTEDTSNPSTTSKAKKKSIISPGIATYSALGISSAAGMGATSADKAFKKPTNSQLSR